MVQSLLLTPRVTGRVVRTMVVQACRYTARPRRRHGEIGPADAVRRAHPHGRPGETEITTTHHGPTTLPAERRWIAIRRLARVGRSSARAACTSSRGGPQRAANENTLHTRAQVRRESGRERYVTATLTSVRGCIRNATNIRNPRARRNAYAHACLTSPASAWILAIVATRVRLPSRSRCGR